MTRLFLAAGVAALAIAAPAASQPSGKGGDKGQAAKAERGGAKAQRGSAKADRGGAKAERGRGNSASAKAERRGGHRMVQSDRRNGAEARGERRSARAAVRDRDDDRRIVRADRNDRDRELVRVRNGDDWSVPGRGHPLGIAGCPPGLMDKGCMPPGQAKNLLGRQLSAAHRDRLLPLGLRDFYQDNDDYYYRLGNGGYVYRVDRDTNVIASLLPLLGAGLMPGQMFPSSFGNSMVPMQYQAFYPNTSDDYYRFANGYVYEVDRNSGMIEDVIPLMAGGYGMGQMLPASYSAYNVPYQYRSMYADTNDYMYRYAPGAIYQVDPTTRLITAVASLLTGNGLSVGQPLPMGYSTYNVPLAYRDQYYDTPNAMYRYNNGNIYQVDPTTQLVTALVRAIV